ncbi:MAG: DUF2269 domain-containing protein [Actinomycetota bacterium]
MTMAPPLRKIVLATHLTCSVGWIGAVVAFMTLIFLAQGTQDGDTLRGSWIAMDAVGRFALVPLSIASLVTGVVISLGTKWGLFRHYWVLISLVLTAVAVFVLVSNMKAVRFFAAMATEPGADLTMLRSGLQSELLHAGGGLVVLLVVQLLNIFKPQGMTRYGWRKQQEQRRKAAQQRDAVLQA